MDSTVVWAAVDTEDKQPLSMEKKHTADASLAGMFTHTMQTMPEESDYLIRWWA
ncbi:hypothetical protein RAE04_10730 [Corynebacterium sp. CTNIH16]|uniref:hypothetical protein n=1 Tax=Corynebacterium sp. CTNIH16 TaxID=3068968 RepID=UPI002934A048|nr:hypothetical protein [Corynebacterium sp. CTNIH16]MDV2427099.1 hypothetical protein [Corynebacterium sp. CTNIH16]